MKVRITKISIVDSFSVFSNRFVSAVGEAEDVADSPIQHGYKEFTFIPDDRSLLPFADDPRLHILHCGEV